ncbi:MAG: penicillin acylase family protein, partial [Herpetosiphonaceae bacterium]|nr:penicillin acylase family protein [Herpetosiphonaceae bacterium]
LFMAQGYVHAQDRLWQMYFDHLTTKGLLSSVIGSPGLATDRFLRTIGLYRAAEQEWAHEDADTRAILQAYADGVNLFITTHRHTLPIEFTLLRTQPDVWTPVDTIAYGNLLSWILGGNYRLELLRARLIPKVGVDVTQQLLAPYGSDKPIIVPPEAGGYTWMRHAGFEGLDAMANLLGDPGASWGSNNWVVSGSRTATGKPILANDTHLTLSMPPYWYENELHGGRYNIVGFTLPGVPTVVIGHNERIAWGNTNLNPDTEDLYIEKLNDSTHPTQYQFMNKWQDLQILHETIPVKNAPAIPFDIMLTQHGPIMNSVIGNLKGAEPMALRWASLGEGSLFKSVALLNRAGNWDQFREAMRYWNLPGQNFVYADVDGNIGYQATGVVPIRPTKDQGLVPMPGWTGENEWQSYIPFEQMPHSFNPPEGFISTANNKVVSDSYPYTLALEWDAGYRAKRLHSLLAANSHISIEAMESIQGDTYSEPSDAIRPYLLALKPANTLEAQALEQVKQWDLRYEVDSVGASVFRVWYWFVVQNTMDSKLGATLAEQYMAGQYERHGTFQVPLMIKLMADPHSSWFDDPATPQVETRDDIGQRSLTQAMAWLKAHYGDQPTGWSWGRLHTMTFVEEPLGDVNLGPLNRLFRSKPIPARGDNFTLDGASFVFTQPFDMDHGVSQRQIVDLGNFDHSLAIGTTGQSGLPLHPHHEDMIDMWQNIQYHPMLFNRAGVESNSEGTLTLTPGASAK